MIEGGGGTVEYMPPEYFDNDIDPIAGDYWAFGCIVYELIFRKHPFAGIDREETVRNIKEKDPIFFESTYETLIKGLLAKNPSLRLKEPEVIRSLLLQFD